MDNSVSAFSGKPRPEYIAMVEAIKLREVDIVIAWQLDRFYRRARELEDHIDLVEQTGVQTHTVMAGAWDLNTPIGRAMARTAVAFATLEVENTRDRIIAQKKQQATRGEFSGGQRPWGYEAGCTAIREEEAAIYREMVDRMLEGSSFNKIALSLNDRGIRTQHDKFWNAVKVRNLLLHARYAGIREHHDQQYEATWPAIITKETWDDLQVAIKAHALRYKQGGPGRRRKFLLTGIVVCGVCGKQLNTQRKYRAHDQNVGIYICLSRDAGNGQGCGTVSRLIAPVDHLISECIISRLESDEFDAALAHTDDDELRELMRQHNAQMMRIEEIRAAYASDGMPRIEYLSLIGTATVRLDELTRQVALATPQRPQTDLPEAHVARTVWEQADLAKRRQIAELLIDRVEIMPSNVQRLKMKDYYAGQWRFKPEDVRIRWRA